MEKMSESLEKVTEYKRQLLREGLDKCTLEQNDIFNRMYKSVETIEPEKMDWALQQVERTVKENEEKKEKNVEKGH